MKKEDVKNLESPKRTKNNLKSSKTRVEESKERGKKPMQYNAM